jgi:hypothetical protein
MHSGSNMTKPAYDRSAEDVGNVLLLEHLNVTVPDQELAALFYVTGLGFTRDPYIDFGTRNMWVNAGENQFHLPKGRPQRFRGTIGIVVPDLEQLHQRLGRLTKALAGTEFAWTPAGGCTHVTCPWGNRFQVCDHGPDGSMELGLAYLDMTVPPGTAEGIARFYRAVMGCAATATSGSAIVHMGRNQTLRFTETDAPIPEYDGHHVAIYVADFSGPHRQFASRGLITEETDAHQYRFQAIFDPENGTTLAELEHEVRSLHHPMYQRPLVNRNSGMDFFTYRKGLDQHVPR